MKILKLLLITLIIFSLLTIIACENDDDSEDSDLADDDDTGDDDDEADVGNETTDDNTGDNDDDDSDEGNETTNTTTTTITVSYIDLLNKVAELDIKLEELGANASSYEDNLDEIEDALDQASTNEDLEAVETDLEDLEINIDAAIAGLPETTTTTNSTTDDEEEEEEEESEPIVVNININTYLTDWNDTIKSVRNSVDDITNESDSIINNTIYNLNASLRMIRDLSIDYGAGLPLAALTPDIDDLRFEVMDIADDIDSFLSEESTSYSHYDKLETASNNLDDLAGEMHQRTEEIEDAYDEAISLANEDEDAEEYDEECFDSDEIDFYTAGYTTGIYYTGTDTSAKHDDVCRDEDDAYDYYCADDGKVKRKTLACEFGCAGGVCLTNQTS
jgi:hypothetical protein